MNNNSIEVSKILPNDNFQNLNKELFTTLENKPPDTPEEYFDLRNKIVEINMPLAQSVARNFQNIHHLRIPIEDLKQAALLGLIRAADTFDPDHFSQAQFSTYAKKCILNHLRTLTKKWNFPTTYGSNNDEGDDTNPVFNTGSREQSPDHYAITNEIVQQGINAAREYLQRNNAKNLDTIVEAWKMRNLQDLNYNEIAQKLNISRNRVNKWIQLFHTQFIKAVKKRRSVVNHKRA